MISSTYKVYTFSLLQIPPKELQSDADEVFKIAVCNPEFDGIMKNLEHQQASDAVHEAVNMLHSAPEPPEAPEPKYIQISEAVGVY